MTRPGLNATERRLCAKAWRHIRRINPKRARQIWAKHRERG